MVLKSCCGNAECDNEIAFKLRFEDTNGTNLIAENLLSGDSIEFFNIDYASIKEKIDSVDYLINDQNEYLIFLPYYIDSLKVNVGSNTVGAYDIILTNYKEKNCCEVYENYNVFYDNEFCGDCSGKTLVITL